jgi:signal transduction histidine kinase/CheY-like chemotaxis protein
VTPAILPLAALLCAVPPLSLPADGPVDAAAHLEFLDDLDGSLSFEDASAPGVAFRPAAGHRGLRPGRAVWLRLRVENATGSAQRWELVYGLPIAEHLDLWIDDGSGASWHRRGGVAVPAGVRDLVDLGPLHRATVELPAEGRAALYLRVQNPLVTLTGVTLERPAALESRYRGVLLLYGVALGAFLVLALVNLQAYRSFRNPRSLLLGGMVAAYGLWLTFLSGLPGALLPVPAWLALGGPLLASGLGSALAVLFGRAMLLPDERLRRPDALVAIAALFAAAGLAGLLVPGPGTLAMALLGMVAVFPVVRQAVRARAAGAPGARTLVGTLALLVLFGTLFVLAVTGWLEPSTLALHGVQLSFAAGTATLTSLLVGQAARRHRQAEDRASRAEEALLASEERVRLGQRMESIGRLAGGVAHDFNNVLTAVAANVDMARLELAPGDPRRQYFDEIGDAARRGAALTRQLLALGRRQLIEPRPTDLSALVEGMGPMLRRLVGEDPDLRLEPTPGLPAVLADPVQLEQVVLNLVLNARDAIGFHGCIAVSTGLVEVEDAAARPDRRPGRYGVVRVGDDGAGIPPEHLARVFEPFFTTKPDGRGTGMGLATVYGIAAQHGGFVEVVSKVGEGSTFSVHLPLAEGAAAAGRTAGGEEPRAHGLPGGREAILLAEDDAAVRASTRTLLRRLGYRVAAAADGEEALALARGGEPVDLLLTDVVMPRLNGRELAERLQAERPGVKVLYVSGYTDEIVDRAGVLHPGVDLLRKPFTAEQLATRVRRALDGR